MRVATQDGGHVQVVGDDAQLFVLHQGMGDGFHRGANVHDERAAVGHMLCHGLSDAGLAVGGQRLALAVGNVLGGRAGHAHAAMKARQQTRFGQTLHITAHGLQGDVEFFCQKLNRGRTLLLNKFKQQGLAWVGGHELVKKEKIRIGETINHARLCAS